MENTNSRLPQVASKDDLSLSDVFQRALKRKVVIFITFFVILFFGLLYFKSSATFFTRNILVGFNSASNNQTFQYVDSLIPSAQFQGSSLDSRNEFSAKSLASLSSESFSKFVLDKSKKDKKIWSSLGIASTSSGEDLEAVSLFFSSKVRFASSDPSGSNLLRVRGSGGFSIEITSEDKDWIIKATPLILELVRDFLQEEEVKDISTTKLLILEKIKLYSRDLEQLVAKGIEVQEQIPFDSNATYQEVQQAIQKTRIALQGSKALERRYSSMLKQLEDRIVNGANAELMNEEKVQEIQKELAGLTYRKQLEESYGVQKESGRIKSLDKSIFENTKKLKSLIKVEGSSFGNLVLESQSHQDSFINTISNLNYVREQSAFSEAQLEAMGEILKELLAQVNLRFVKQIEKADIDRSIGYKQKLLDNLETANTRLDLADFKIQKRFDFYIGKIQQKGRMPFGSFMAMVMMFGAAIGFYLAYRLETKNPSLVSIKDFEHYGMSVLGGVPSTKTFLFNQSTVSVDDHNTARYVKIALLLSDLLFKKEKKIVLFTSGDSSFQSSTICYNLGAYFARTNKKVLIIDTDMRNNFILKLTGVGMNGRLHELESSTKINDIDHQTIEEGLSLISGSRELLPQLYRLASEGFGKLIDKKIKEFDFIFIHSQSLLLNSEASDLSRFAEVSLVSVDALTAHISLTEKLIDESKSFRSPIVSFLIENNQDFEVFEQPKSLDTSVRKIQRSEVKPPPFKKAG